MKPSTSWKPALHRCKMHNSLNGSYFEIFSIARHHVVILAISNKLCANPMKIKNSNVVIPANAGIQRFYSTCLWGLSLLRKVIFSLSGWPFLETSAFRLVFPPLPALERVCRGRERRNIRGSLMKLGSLLLVALLGTVGWAQAADLLDIYHSAQSNDPVFAAARATQQAGQEKLPQGRSLLLPSVNLSANSTFNDLNTQYRPAIPPFLTGGINRYNSHGYGVTLTQPLFRQQNWIAYTEAELQVAQTEAQFKAAEQNLIVRVAQAYFDVLIAQDSVQLAEAQKTAITEQLEQAKRNFEVGTSTITDTYEA